jgi:[ribosomal protein S5]-alanine N-acetyltransferase
MSIRIAPLSVSDLLDVQVFASDEALSQTSNIPWPYPDEGAWSWYASLQSGIAEGRSVVFSIHQDGFSGIVSLNDIRVDSKSFEVDYWVCRPKWGTGVCSEAVRQAILYAKHALSLDTAFSACLVRNPASSKVLLKNSFEETRRFTNAGQFGGKYLEPMIRYRKIIREGARPCRDPKVNADGA